MNASVSRVRRNASFGKSLGLGEKFFTTPEERRVAGNVERANKFDWDYHVARIGYGPFAADVHVPFSVDTEAAEASYENGFLHIILPRTKAHVRAMQAPPPRIPSRLSRMPGR